MTLHTGGGGGGGGGAFINEATIVNYDGNIEGQRGLLTINVDEGARGEADQLAVSDKGKSYERTGFVGSAGKVFLVSKMIDCSHVSQITSYVKGITASSRNFTPS